MLFKLFKIVAACLCVLFPIISSAQQKDPCTLPPGLQSVIAHNFPGAKLITLVDLSNDHKKLYAQDHHDSCPGLTKVNFYSDGNPTWALGFSLGEDQKQKALLVVARQEGNIWKTKQLDSAPSSIPVVWSQKPGKYILSTAKKVSGQQTL